MTDIIDFFACPAITGMWTAFLYILFDKWFLIDKYKDLLKFDCNFCIMCHMALVIHIAGVFAFGLPWQHIFTAPVAIVISRKFIMI